MIIAICDDEPTISDTLKVICKEFFSFELATSILVFNGGQPLLLEYMKGTKVDILFLDIELVDSNGIEIAKKIRQLDKNVKIIFTTNYENFKSEAFSVRAFGYIDKPISPPTVIRTLQDALKYSEIKYIELESSNGAISVPKDDILYFENNHRKVSLITFNNKFRVYQKISELTIELSQTGFDSPHVSFLVNLDYIQKIRNYTLFMINGDEIPLSQKKSASFRKIMNNYLRNIIHEIRGGVE